ncbi:MAG: hypothetical protein N3I35_08205 [Clostridia bacterium]|nr:hypothetical protein [Clostridia bacterium]
MKCDFCGVVFDENKSRKGCAGCPMNNSCKKIKCPNCNYEMHPEPEMRLIETIRKWGGKIWKKEK